MPNVWLNMRLKEQYGITTNTDLETVTKSLSTFLPNSVDLSTAGLRPHIARLFESRRKRHVVLAFLDLCDFSGTTRDAEAKSIADKLDRYYAIAVPLIYQHGGVVEKIIGDGIIVLFDDLDDSRDYLSNVYRSGRAFARDVLLALAKADFGAKVALHDGPIIYYSPVLEEYLDLTVVGEPLTELFRLESVALPNTVCVYDADHGRYREVFGPARSSSKKPLFFRGDARPVKLQGLGKRMVLDLTPLE